MIAITGYTGFVGQELLKSYSPSECVLLGRKPLDGYKNHCFFDLTDTDDLEISKALNGVSTCIHTAARVHIMQDRAIDPLQEFRRVNTQGTLALAREAAKAGVKRFIFISSIKVNGESTTGRSAFKAQDKPMPQDPYAISKAEAEEQLLQLANDTGMEVVIIRPPLVYGKGVKANFASLMKAVAKGYPLPLRAINKNKRSLVSVYNLVSLIDTCRIHPNAANKIFLVSDKEDISTSQMLKLMAKVQNKRNLAFPIPVFCFKLMGRLFKKEAVIDRLIGSLQVDIDYTQEVLDWYPKITLQEGFKITARYLD